MTASWQTSMKALRDFTRKETGARCELCATDIGAQHQHLLDPKTRKIICGCQGCCLLFDTAGRTKYRRIPRDVTLLAGFQLPEGEWNRLLIPISLGFIYRSSAANAMIACYPSPLGMAESRIDEAPWLEITAANPSLAQLREDVEALLVNRLRGQREYFVAPIDRCFKLVGIVRRHWQGMNGGDRVWIEVDQYLAALKAGARR